MKILYFDCFSGISGDMAIGALLDLGIDREVFLKELSRLGLDGYRLEITTKTMNGIRGTDVNVILNDEGQDHNHEYDHSHEDDCSHNRDGHGHRDECRCGSEDDHMDDHGHQHSHSHEEDHGHDHDHVSNHGGHDHLHCSCEHLHDGNDHPHFGYDHPYDSHDHPHGSCEYPHDRQHDRGHEHPHTHGERGLVEIEQIIDRSRLSEKVKAFSKKVFHEIAAAEAKVHGKTIYEVHFHEVGAIDSIIDIAGMAICLELLGAERVYSSALHDGKGFIECRHGIIPVPVPAVMEMLNGSGIPLIEEDIGTELVTPTGMGLIKCMSSGFGSRPPMLAEKTGYGLGKRDTGRFNALRVILGETYEEKAGINGDERHEEKDAVNGTDLHEEQEAVNGSDRHGDEVIVLETNIDDTTAEILGYTMSKLIEAGALDAFYTPIYMKKNRPAYMLTALALPDQEDLLAQIILSQTSTLGIRTRPMKRYCMERKTVSVRTPYGEARIKVATLGGIQKASPEYEDCRKIAESTGLPLAKAYALVAAEAAKQYGL